MSAVPSLASSYASEESSKSTDGPTNGIRDCYIFNCNCSGREIQGCEGEKEADADVNSIVDDQDGPTFNRRPRKGESINTRMGEVKSAAQPRTNVADPSSFFSISKLWKGESINTRMGEVESAAQPRTNVADPSSFFSISTLWRHDDTHKETPNDNDSDEGKLVESGTSRTSTMATGGGLFKTVSNVSKALKAFKQPPIRDPPTEKELARGLQVENIFDFWDPVRKKMTQRRMNEDVLHRRNRRASEFALPAADSSTEASSDSDEVEFSPRLSPRPSRGRRDSYLRRTYTFSNTEVVTTWGALVGKLLHTRILDFGELKNKTMRMKELRAESPATTRIGYGVQQRLRLVAKQALVLARNVAKEQDMLDSEWNDQNLLIQLFSTEYVDTIMLMANVACKVFSTQPPLAVAKVPCKVYGDTHGQLRDVLQFFTKFGNPMEDLGMSFVFNGDFVDRGCHQLEVLGILLSLKILYPERVYLVRGNHEDRNMNEKYGFEDVCRCMLGDAFGPKVFELMQSVFDRLPVACLVEGEILCVHGGIGDGTWKLEDLRCIPRVLTADALLMPANSWIFNILWSDPIEDGQDYDPQVFGVHLSPRASYAAQFAWDVTKTFCSRNGLNLIIRSHQSKKGSAGFDVMHENLLVRVFSARDYEGHGNDGAILQVTREEHEGKEILVVRPQVVRSVAKSRHDGFLPSAPKGRRSQPAPDIPGARRSPRH